MGKKNAVTDLDVVRTHLRNHGLRATGTRVAVYATLTEFTSPASHTEVSDRVSKYGVDRATVYRNLVDMTEAGMLTRTDFGDHVWRFSLPHHKAPVNQATKDRDLAVLTEFCRWANFDEVRVKQFLKSGEYKTVS